MLALILVLLKICLAAPAGTPGSVTVVRLTSPAINTVTGPGRLVYRANTITGSSEGLAVSRMEIYRPEGGSSGAVTVQVAAHPALLSQPLPKPHGILRVQASSASLGFSQQVSTGAHARQSANDRTIVSQPPPRQKSSTDRKLISTAPAASSRAIHGHHRPLLQLPSRSQQPKLITNRHPEITPIDSPALPSRPIVLTERVVTSNGRQLGQQRQQTTPTQQNIESRVKSAPNNADQQPAQQGLKSTTSRQPHDASRVPRQDAAIALMDNGKHTAQQSRQPKTAWKAQGVKVGDQKLVELPRHTTSRQASSATNLRVLTNNDRQSAQNRQITTLHQHSRVREHVVATASRPIRQSQVSGAKPPNHHNKPRKYSAQEIAAFRKEFYSLPKLEREMLLRVYKQYELHDELARIGPPPPPERWSTGKKMLVGVGIAAGVLGTGIVIDELAAPKEYRLSGLAG